jgi:xanthine dehydrogenase large subunit
VDDLPELAGTLFAKAYYSKIAHGTIKKLDYSKALTLPGVHKVLTYKDIPGENQIGGIVADEPLLAEKEVHFIGQPILLILAENDVIAHKALELIEIDIRPKRIIVDPIEAQQAGELLVPPRSLSIGNTEAAFSSCKYVFEGMATSGGQEHVYLETQGAYAIPQGNGNIKIHSSTQGPTAVQRTAARVLGCPMNAIEVDVNRIGGGFGGKEDQASLWGSLVALAAHLTQKPVKYILERKEDLQMTGKRHPYKSRYKIGLDKDYKIIAFEGQYYQNGGAATDLSPAVLGRTLFHSTNSYFIPNVAVKAYSCRTNLPPNTAFRGFGGPQGMFVIEAAIHHAARVIGVPASVIQEKNLLFEGAEFPYGQITEACEAQNCWQQSSERYNLKQIQQDIAIYNQENEYSKKGLALMPICFGISFTNTMMNNARALLHVYGDGSVGISTGAVEMGQGVNSKMIQIAALHFGISSRQIKLETTNTTRVANTSPSAASATADLNGKALQDACNQVEERLVKLLKKEWNLDKNATVSFQNGYAFSQNNHSIAWEDLIQLALSQRINLSAKGHYATPRIQFDRAKGKGHPFAYHVYGTALITCTVDCLRGTYDFDAVKITHDFGSSMNPAVDLGQIEGGLIQGMGWMTLEDLIYNEKGQLKSHSLANYKIPDIHYGPKKMEVHYLDTPGSDLAILKSKAVGEPPLMYGIAAYFSLYNAILAFNPKAKMPYAAPMTTEKILMGLYS